jgi:LPS-assembly lipoprotein
MITSLNYYRITIIFVVASLSAACFRPIYGNYSQFSGSGVEEKLAQVEVRPILAANGTAQARIGHEVRQALIFALNGGNTGGPPTHHVTLNVSASHAALVVDPFTARPELEVETVNATYVVVEIATSRVVANGETFAKVSHETPGQEQRFARARGLRDAENRASKIIAENIRNRLISYFVAGV